MASVGERICYLDSPDLQENLSNNVKRYPLRGCLPGCFVFDIVTTSKLNEKNKLSGKLFTKLLINYHIKQ